MLARAVLASLAVAPRFDAFVSRAAALYDILLYGSLQPLNPVDTQQPQADVEAVRMVAVAYEADAIMEDAGVEMIEVGGAATDFDVNVNPIHVGGDVEMGRRKRDEAEERWEERRAERGSPLHQRGGMRW